jgi:hypothetical protein
VVVATSPGVRRERACRSGPRHHHVESRARWIGSGGLAALQNVEWECPDEIAASVRQIAHGDVDADFIPAREGHCAVKIALEREGLSGSERCRSYLHRVAEVLVAGKRDAVANRRERDAKMADVHALRTRIRQLDRNGLAAYPERVD